MLSNPVTSNHLSPPRRPFRSSQRGLRRQPDVGAPGVEPAAGHRAPRRPVVQRGVPPVPQRRAAGVPAVRRRRGVRLGQAEVNGDEGGDQQTESPHAVHLRDTGTSTRFFSIGRDGY